MTVSLGLACGVYDRTAALADGRVRPEGIDLTFVPLPAEEVFHRSIVNREFDVTEISLSSYVMSLQRDAPFMAIPVFPSRAFRHNGIYVNSASGIAVPADLRGRSVGIPEYQMTAAVWIRGMLADEYGVPVDSVHYRTGGLTSPGRSEKIPIRVVGVDIQPIESHRTLDELLVSGEIDALYTPRAPRSFVEGHPAVRRLWTEPESVEREYFTRTRMFPIMHTVAIRRDQYEKAPWIARSLMKAFAAAAEPALASVADTGTLPSMGPWSYREAERSRALLGTDFWPAGASANATVLATFLRYQHEQGLIDRLWAPHEIFAPETLAEFIV